jgi:hypothetical protein
VDEAEVGNPERMMVLPVFVDGDEDASDASLRWLVPESGFAVCPLLKVGLVDGMELVLDVNRVRGDSVAEDLGAVGDGGAADTEGGILVDFGEVGVFVILGVEAGIDSVFFADGISTDLGTTGAGFLIGVSDILGLISPCLLPSSTLSLSSRTSIPSCPSALFPRVGAGAEATSPPLFFHVPLVTLTPSPLVLPAADALDEDDDRREASR